MVAVAVAPAEGLTEGNRGGGVLRDVPGGREPVELAEPAEEAPGAVTLEILPLLRGSTAYWAGFVLGKWA